MLVLLFVFGGAAACSDDDGDDGGDSDTTEEDSGDSGDSGGGDSGNSDVQAYCDAVDEYVAEVNEVLEDPTGDTSALTETGTELANQATELSGAGLSAEDAEAVAECSQEAASALTGG
ncbi:hypothetical protein B7486_51960 [cyanobacterium TDX16]|nr:hypothetical protein B7486_51960 [cyanobacterium TDX16]